MRSKTYLVLLIGVFLAGLMLVGPCDLANIEVAAEGYSYYATTNVTAGDVVIFDTSANYGVKTTTTSASTLVAGVADQSVSSGNRCRIQRNNGRVAVNITGSVDPEVNPYLVSATTQGKAVGVASFQEGVFGIAITSSGTPAAGQCYAAIDVNLLDGLGATDHGALTGLSDDDHTQYGALAQNETVTGEWTFGTSFPISPSAAPDADYEFANKKYVDDNEVGATDHGALTGLADDDHTQYGALAQNETVSGEWTFGTSFPISPSAAPDADYEFANKKYVDDTAAGGGDPDSVHLDQANEYIETPVKAAAVLADLFLGEDSADSGNKKWFSLYSIAEALKSYRVKYEASSDFSFTVGGEIGVKGADAALALHFGSGHGGEIENEAQISGLSVISVSFDPGSWYNTDTQVFLFTVGDEAPNGIIIDEWKFSCNVDPDVEIDANLKYADAWIGLANAAVIDAIDTTNGASSEDTDANINAGAAVANGKIVYLEFDADPEGTCVQGIFEMWYHAEED